MEIEKSKSAQRAETEPLPDAVKFLDNRPVHRCKHSGGCHPQLPFLANDEVLRNHIPISSDRPYLQHLMLSLGEENLPVDVRAMAKSCDFQSIDQSSDLNAILRCKDFGSEIVKRMNKYMLVAMNKALQNLRCNTIPLFRGATACLHGSTAENTRVADQCDVVVFLPLIFISEYSQHFPIKTNNLQFELEERNNIKSMLRQYLMETDDESDEQWTVHTMLGKCVAKSLQPVMEETTFKYATRGYDKMKGMTLKRMCYRHTAVVLTFGYETYEIKINLTFGIRDETSVPDTGDSNLIKPLREQPLYGFYILNQWDVFSSTCTFDEIFHMQNMPCTRTHVYVAAKSLIEMCLPVCKRKCGCKHSLFPSYHLKLVFFHMTKYYRDSNWWTRHQWGNRVLEMFVVYSLCLRFGIINNILSGPSSPPVSGINTVITVCSDPCPEIDKFILDDDWERFVYNFLTCTGSRHVVEYLKLPRYKYQCCISCATLVARVCLVLAHLKQSTSRGDETEVLYDRKHRPPDKIADLVWKEANSKYTEKNLTVGENPHTSPVKRISTMPSLNMLGLLANIPKRNETYLQYMIGSCSDANIAQTLRDITSNCGIGEADKSSKLALAIEKLTLHCNVMYTEKAREVERRVVDGVNTTLHALRKVHKRTFRGVTAILLGSSAEKTKTHLPDEWDFVVFIPALYEVRQNLFPVQRELEVGKSLMTRLLYQNRLSDEMLRSNVLGHVHTEGEKTDYGFIQNSVDLVLKKFISDLLIPTIKDFTFKHVCYEHTATALTFASDSLEIKIDLSIGMRDESSVPVTNDVMLVRPLEEQPEYGFYILRGQYFVPTSTFQELSFMHSLSDNKRLCYQIAKCFIERCIPSTGGYLDCECVKPVFPSFYLKLILFHMCKHYEEESDWLEDQFSNRILEMYIAYCSCLTTGVLDVEKPPMQQKREESQRIRKRYLLPTKDVRLSHSSSKENVAKCSQRLSDLTDSHEIIVDFIDYLREQLKTGTVIPKLEVIKAFCTLLCRLKTEVP